MPRPKCCRRVSGAPACKLFQPMGMSASSAEGAVLTLDEYEAIRLADYEGLYQEQAAGRMGVSRQTFGRTIEAARRTVARALVLGLALRIDLNAGGPCCAGRPEACPACCPTRNTPDT